MKARLKVVCEMPLTHYTVTVEEVEVLATSEKCIKTDTYGWINKEDKTCTGSKTISFIDIDI